MAEILFKRKVWLSFRDSVFSINENVGLRPNPVVASKGPLKSNVLLSKEELSHSLCIPGLDTSIILTSWISIIACYISFKLVVSSCIIKHCNSKDLNGAVQVEDVYRQLFTVVRDNISGNKLRMSVRS